MMVSMVLPTECIHFPRMECQLGPATFCSPRVIASAQSSEACSESKVPGAWAELLQPLPLPSLPPALATLAGPSSEPARPHRCGNCQMLWWFKCAVEAFIKVSCSQLTLSKAAGECYAVAADGSVVAGPGLTTST